jgi:anaerobic nitric oxide reductase flavorubredoxin
MERYELKENIWWVGAIDWNVRDFHGYETPRGTTYNSYLITDEKPALIDGVRTGFGPECLRRVRSCCDPSQIEYLVVNHVELDHSGAVPWLVEQLSPVKVVCSKRGQEGLLRHFHSEGAKGWDFQVVASGDELSLGRYTLSFLEVPMVHWPDSMFTYVKEAKVLLPNDGFGQHYASSRRFADENDMDLVMDEASKYYANILMPLGGPISKTIQKVVDAGLEFDVVAPSHGVIWRRPEDIQRIIEAYVGWTKFAAEPKVALIFDTMWHSTEKMTRAIEDGIAQEGVECSVFRLSRSSLADTARAVMEHRAFLVGSPTLNNGMFPSVGGFLTYLKGLKPKERLAGAYGSFGWAGGAVKQVDAELTALGLQKIEPLELKFIPSEDDIAACVEHGRAVARAVKAWGDGK